MTDHDTHDHTGIPGVGGSSDLDAIIAASSGEDIADALAGANAPDAGNVFATMADVGGGGGTGARYPVQEIAAGNASTNSQAATWGATPTNGNLLVLVSYNEGSGNITGITQTNVTWTLVVQSTATTAPHVEIWKGVVSGSAGTSTTVAYSSSNFCGWSAYEWSGVTGTVDQSATRTNSTNHTIPVITPTVSTVLVVSGAAESTFGGDFVAGSPGPTYIHNLSQSGFANAWAFPGTESPLGTWANTHGGTCSIAVVSLT